jgi:hypothetical protein
VSFCAKRFNDMATRKEAKKKIFFIMFLILIYYFNSLTAKFLNSQVAEPADELVYLNPMVIFCPAKAERSRFPVDIKSQEEPSGTI